MGKRGKIIILIVLIVLILVALGVFLGIRGNRNYNIEEITTKDYFALYQNGKVGVINTKGEVLIEPIYDNIQIPNPTKPVFICLFNYNKQTDTYTTTIRNEKNEEIFNQYEEVSSIKINGIAGEIPYEKSALKYKKNNRYGLLGFDGKEITKPIYEEIDSLPYKEGEFIVKKDGKYGVINPKGTKMLNWEYDDITGDGYYDKNYKNAGYIAGIKSEEGYLYSYVNCNGKVLLKKEYNDIVRINEINDSNNVFLIASKTGKKGLFKNNKQIIPCEYQSLEYNEETKLVIAKRNDKYGVFDLNGKEILSVNNSELAIKGIHILATKDNKQSEYDLNGKEVSEMKYKSVSATNNEEFFITVNQSNRYGLINKKEVEVIENKYAYLEYLTGKYFAVYSDDNKIGIIDSSGRIVLDMKYDVVQKIKGSNLIQAIVLKDNNVELYTEDIKQVTSQENASVYLADNYIKLVSPNKVSYFKLDGTETTSKEIFPDNELFATVKNGFWGFEDKEGKIKIERKYDSVTEFNKYGFAGIKQNGKWGVIDKSGNIIVEPIYLIEQKNTEPKFLGKYYEINYNGDTYYTNEVK